MEATTPLEHPPPHRTTHWWSSAAMVGRQGHLTIAINPTRISDRSANNLHLGPHAPTSKLCCVTRGCMRHWVEHRLNRTSSLPWWADLRWGWYLYAYSLWQLDIINITGCVCLWLLRGWARGVSRTSLFLRLQLRQDGRWRVRQSSGADLQCIIVCP